MLAQLTSPMPAVLSFDCYGTIVDWERGILDVLRPWAAEAAGLKPPLDDEHLLAAFAEAEPQVEAENPNTLYPDVLARTVSRIATQLGIPDDLEVRARLGSSIGDWPAFADSREALSCLQRQFKLVVLSNVDRTSFERTCQQLPGVKFAHVITAEDVGAYKPDRRMFDALFSKVRELGFDQSQMLHVAQSLYHDIVPAGAFGARTVWIDRRAGRGGGATRTIQAAVEPTATLGSLAELAASLTPAQH